MNLEAIDLFVQTKYLHQELAGARIKKIYMPTPTSLLLQCHKEKTLPLLCDLGQNGPALYLPKELPQTPDSPLNFCMLLRKHLESGHIVRLEQKNFDRIIEMTVNAPIPGDKTTPKVLVFELMGRSNNIILRQDEKTLGSLRKIHAIPAEQKRLHPLAVEAVKLAQAIQANPAPNLKQKITSTLLGIGSHTAEILAQAEDLTTALRELQDKYSKPADSRINDLIIEKITASPLQLDLQKNLQGIIKGEINKNAKKLQALTEELVAAENAEE
ncbi:MAG: NFACT family protein [Acidaminococcaceae bacterium]|nr:NFACT family protein [Acidaminococcaceae bacterium]